MKQRPIKFSIQDEHANELYNPHTTCFVVDDGGGGDYTSRSRSRTTPLTKFKYHIKNPCKYCHSVGHQRASILDRGPENGLLLCRGILCICTLKKLWKYTHQRGYNSFQACVPRWRVEKQPFFELFPCHSIRTRTDRTQKWQIFFATPEDFQHLGNPLVVVGGGGAKSIGQAFFSDTLSHTLKSNQTARLFEIALYDKDHSLPPIDSAETAWVIFRGIDLDYEIGLADYQEIDPQIRWFLSNPLCKLVHNMKLPLSKMSGRAAGTIVFDLKFPIIVPRDGDAQTKRRIIGKNIQSGFLNVDLFTSVFVDQYETRRGLNAAGSSGFSLVDLFRMGTHTLRGTTFLEAHIILPEAIRSPKGKLTIYGIESIEWEGFDAPSANATPPIHPMRIEFPLCRRYISEIQDTLRVWKPTYRFMELVHSLVYLGRGGQLPSVSFFDPGTYDHLPRDGHEMDSWFNLISVALSRISSISLEELAKSKGSDADVLVAKVLSTALTLYSNYGSYLPDFAFIATPKRGGDNGFLRKKTLSSTAPLKPTSFGADYFATKTPTEHFSIPCITDFSDCEDDTKYMTFMGVILRSIYRQLQGKYLQSLRDRVLFRVGQIFDRYYLFGCLAGVNTAYFTQQQAPPPLYGNNQNRQQSSSTDTLSLLHDVEAHEFAILVPRDYVFDLMLNTPSTSNTDDDDDELSGYSLSSAITDDAHLKNQLIQHIRRKKNQTSKKSFVGSAYGNHQSVSSSATSMIAEEDEESRSSFVLPLLVCEGTGIVSTFPTGDMDHDHDHHHINTTTRGGKETTNTSRRGPENRLMGTIPELRNAVIHEAIREYFTCPGDSGGFYKVLSTLFTADFVFEGGKIIELTLALGGQELTNSTYGIPFGDFIARKTLSSVRGNPSIQLIPQKPMSDELFRYTRQALQEEYPIPMIYPPPNPHFGVESALGRIAQLRTGITHVCLPQDQESASWTTQLFIPYDRVDEAFDSLSDIIRLCSPFYRIRIDNEPISLNYKSTALFGGFRILLSPL